MFVILIAVTSFHWWRRYLDWTWFSHSGLNNNSKRHTFEILLLAFCISIPTPSAAHKILFPLFPAFLWWTCKKTLPSFHSDITSLLFLMPQFLASGRNRVLTREIILVKCQYLNRQEELSSHWGQQESMPEKQMKMTWCHLVPESAVESCPRCGIQV